MSTYVYVLFGLEMWETSQSRVNNVAIKLNVLTKYVTLINFVLAFE